MNDISNKHGGLTDKEDDEPIRCVQKNPCKPHMEVEHGHHGLHELFFLVFRGDRHVASGLKSSKSECTLCGGGLEHFYDISHHIGNGIVIPTDFHSIIFQRRRYTTNQFTLW